MANNLRRLESGVYEFGYDGYARYRRLGVIVGMGNTWIVCLAIDGKIEPVADCKSLGKAKREAAKLIAAELAAREEGNNGKS